MILTCLDGMLQFAPCAHIGEKPSVRWTLPAFAGEAEGTMQFGGGATGMIDGWRNLKTASSLAEFRLLGNEKIQLF
jgi:hypothetical protein